jgi:hypothetical protein
MRVGLFALVLSALLLGALSVRPTPQAHAATLSPIQQQQAHAGKPIPQEPHDNQCLLIYSGKLNFLYYDQSLFGWAGGYVWDAQYNLKNNCGGTVTTWNLYMDIALYCNGVQFSEFDSWIGGYVWYAGQTRSTTRDEATECLYPGTDEPAPLSIHTYTWGQGYMGANTVSSNGWSANLHLNPPF